MAHNIILRALNLGEDKSKTDRGSDISRLQLFISKGGAGKSYVLNGLITLLKENDNFKENNGFDNNTSESDSQIDCVDGTIAKYLVEQNFDDIEDILIT